MQGQALAASYMQKSNEVRLAKLRDLLGRLKRGETVQNRQLRTWLGDEGYKVYEDQWSNSVELRQMLSAKPADLIEYEGLLKKATLLYNRGEAASIKGQHNVARPLHAKAQVAFEHALLRLEEMMSLDPSLQIWLDRPCDFTTAGLLSIDPIGLPRVVTSRSHANQRGGISGGMMNKRQCKIRAVEEEIERIENPTNHPSDQQISEKLQNLRTGWKKVVISL